MIPRDFDAVDSHRAAAVLVGCSPRAALRMRVGLVGSEVTREWETWADGNPALMGAVNEVAAAVRKLQAMLAQEMK